MSGEVREGGRSRLAELRGAVAHVTSGPAACWSVGGILRSGTVMLAIVLVAITCGCRAGAAGAGRSGWRRAPVDAAMRLRPQGDRRVDCPVRCDTRGKVITCQARCPAEP